MYSYLCPECNTENVHSTFRRLGDTLNEPCDVCGHPYVIRAICRLNFTLSLPEHFNMSTGQYVSNRRSFKDQLKRKSDQMSERTGFESNYIEVDPTDKKAVGVTDD